MMEEAVEIELEYGKYLLDNFPIMGLTEETLVKTVHNYANERLKAIGLAPMFKDSKITYLQQLVEKNLKVNNIRTNIFEGNSTNYSKGNIDMDNF
jgi:ribonucleoside-diphosphate reductase beta chain